VDRGGQLYLLWWKTSTGISIRKRERKREPWGLLSLEMPEDVQALE
jgi:hypothetical protein